MTIALPNLPPLSHPAGNWVGIYFDADQNAATGQYGGYDYLLGTIGGDPPYFGLFKWAGDHFVQVPAPPDIYVNWLGQLTFKITASQIGIGSAFDFTIVTETREPLQPGRGDIAPDTGTGTWSVPLSATPASPPTTTPSPTPPTETTPTPTTPPARPSLSLGPALVATGGIHAGRRFMVAEKLSGGAKGVRVSCTARVAGKPLRTRGAHSASRATCSGLIPARTAGKRLVGMITATVAGAKASKGFSFLVAP